MKQHAPFKSLVICFYKITMPVYASLSKCDVLCYPFL